MLLLPQAFDIGPLAEGARSRTIERAQLMTTSLILCRSVHVAPRTDGTLACRSQGRVERESVYRGVSLRINRLQVGLTA